MWEENFKGKVLCILSCLKKRIFFLKRNFFCMCEFKAWGNLG